jgi:hypothetical protein
MGIMDNGKGYITEREWQEWMRKKYNKPEKDFQEYCQIKGCGKPSVQAIITHDAGEKPICSECLKRFFVDVMKYDWKTEKWRCWIYDNQNFYLRKKHVNWVHRLWKNYIIDAASSWPRK